VPHGPEQWDGRRRRLAGFQTVKKDSDLSFMNATLPKPLARLAMPRDHRVNVEALFLRQQA
jgi:hypothetical protein